MRKIFAVFLLSALVGCNRPEAPQSAAEPKPAPATDSTSTAAVASVLREIPPSEIATPQLSGTCNLEKIGGTVVPDAKPIVVAGRQFQVAGWLFDDSVHKAPEELFLRLTSKQDGKVWEQQVQQNGERPDVQSTNGGLPALLKTGFSAQVDATALPVGEYAAIMSYRRDAVPVVCDNGRSIVIN